VDHKPKPNNGDRAQAKGGGDTPPRRKGECRYCGIKGHWAKECRKRERDRREKGHKAHIAQAEEASPAMLLTTSVTDVGAHSVTDAGTQYVFLNEERVVPIPTNGRRWFLDSRASNHMTGCREMVMQLDEKVRGTVKFGDGSLVEIHGRGVVLFSCRSGEHCAFTNVYFIPKLRTNIISLGQLDEAGWSVIGHGELKLYDQGTNFLPVFREQATGCIQSNSSRYPLYAC
jgi:hypothetical protein